MSKLAKELFQFIDSEEINNRLKADLDELNRAMDANLWKASIVLIGR
jgi:hypothetical protein